MPYYCPARVVQYQFCTLLPALLISFFVCFFVCLLVCLLPRVCLAYCNFKGYLLSPISSLFSAICFCYGLSWCYDLLFVRRLSTVCCLLSAICCLPPSKLVLTL
jgi:hypothetical protein